MVDPYAARQSRTPCPDCGRVGTMTLSEVWRIPSYKDGKIGFSLSGVMPKFSARQYNIIACGADDIKGCGWFCPGLYEDGYFHAIPHLKDEYEALG